MFYCCPECPFKISNSISFTNHALKYHPKAKDKFGDIFVPDLDELEDLQDAVKGKRLSINDVTHLGGRGDLPKSVKKLSIKNPAITKTKAKQCFILI